MPPAQRRKAPFYVEAITGMMWLSSLGLFFWLTRYYFGICPTEPDNQIGVIYPLNEHGRVVYLSLAQHRNLQEATALWIVGACFLVGLAIWTRLPLKQRT